MQGHENVLLLQDLFDLYSKLRNFRGYDIPDNIIINAKVIMDQLVSGTGHSPPVNSIMFFPEIIRKFFDSFSNYLNTADKGPFESFIFRNCFLLSPSDLFVV